MAAPLTEILEWVESNVVTLEKQASEFTVYSGSRRSSNANMSLFRKIVSKTYALLVNLITGIKSEDTQCGFKLYPATLGKKVFSQLHDLGWAHDVEILLRSQKEGAKIVYLPIRYHEAQGSKLHVFRNSLPMVWTLLKAKSTIKNNIK